MTNSTKNQNLFETAVRNRYRFNYKGLISVEDLLELTVTELDSIFRGLNKELKQVTEESLLATKTQEDTEVENKIALIKLIVAEKLAESEARIKAQEKKAQQQEIMALIKRKQQESLESLTEEQLQELLEQIK